MSKIDLEELKKLPKEEKEKKIEEVLNYLGNEIKKIL